MQLIIRDLIYRSPLKAYYERKVAEGKHKFSVLNAVRAKIAARCFAVVRRGTPYVALQI